MYHFGDVHQFIRHCLIPLDPLCQLHKRKFLNICFTLHIRCDVILVLCLLQFSTKMWDEMNSINSSLQ